MFVSLCNSWRHTVGSTHPKKAKILSVFTTGSQIDRQKPNARNSLMKRHIFPPLPSTLKRLLFREYDQKLPCHRLTPLLRSCPNSLVLASRGSRPRFLPLWKGRAGDQQTFKTLDKEALDTFVWLAHCGRATQQNGLHRLVLNGKNACELAKKKKNTHCRFPNPKSPGGVHRSNKTVLPRPITACFVEVLLQQFTVESHLVFLIVFDELSCEGFHGHGKPA